MKTPSFAKACGQVGAEPPEGLRREKPTAVTPAPEACAHTPAHTLARRALGRRARQPGSMVQSARPTPAVAPRLQATPPTLHPRKAIGQRGGAALRELAARAGDPPRSRSALQKPRQDWRDRGGWRCLARALPQAPGLRRRQQLRTCPLCVRCGQLEAAGRRVQAAGAQLLTGSAGGRAWRQQRLLVEWPPETRSAAWKALQEVEEESEVALPQTCASGVTSCHRCHPGRTPLLFSLHFSLRCPPAPGAPACAPHLHPRRARRRQVPAMSLLFWDRSASALGKLAPQAQPRFFSSYLPAAEAAGWRPGKRVERDAAAPEESGVAKTWQLLLEAGAPGVSPRAQRVQVRRAPDTSSPPTPFPPETTQELVPKEPSGLRWS